MKSLNMTISSFGEDLNTLKPGYFAKACDFVPEFLVPTARMVMVDDDTISYHVDKDKPCLSCSAYVITPRGILTKIVVLDMAMENIMVKYHFTNTVTTVTETCNISITLSKFRHEAMRAAFLLSVQERTGDMMDRIKEHLDNCCNI